jgi:hypothetical protein
VTKRRSRAVRGAFSLSLRRLAWIFKCSSDIFGAHL